MPRLLVPSFSAPDDAGVGGEWALHREPYTGVSSPRYRATAACSRPMFAGVG